MTDKSERWQSVLTALLARADHPATPKAEAELARSKALELAGKYSIDLRQKTQIESAPEVQPPAGQPAGHVEVQDHDPFAAGCRCRMFIPEQWLGISPEAMASYSPPQVAERLPTRDCPILVHQVDWALLAHEHRRGLTKGQGYA